MGQALYRKYRSRKFSEVIGQEHITDTLTRAISAGKISHAYLFTGPKGVGKTSIARILAHEVNGLSYHADTLHLDIIEIDAASNRRIDEIRDLRDKVHIAPASAKYKVYIIDEAHMLTREAFNALLKTLEEPPAHCIFILATTEAHKLPETIISRTQRFTFKPIAKKVVAEHLSKIAKKEGLSVTSAALELLAEHGGGSFRDSIGLLDQISNSGKSITEDHARTFLGLPPKELIQQLVSYIDNGLSKEALTTVTSLREQGASAVASAQHLSKLLRGMLLTGPQRAWVTQLLKQLVDVAASAHPDDFLEICVLEAASTNQPGVLNKPEASSKAARTSSAKTVFLPAESNTRKLNSATKPPLDRPMAFTMSMWPKVVEKSKHEAASLYTALRLASPTFIGNKIVLHFEFPLHQKKITQAKNLSKLQSIIEDISGGKLQIECRVDKELFKKFPLTSKKVAAFQPASAITNIFGASEVLES